MSDTVEIGVIGGSGLYQIEGLTNLEEIQIQTPYGPTSDKFRLGTLGGKRIAFLPRHGRNHSLLPSEVPHKANIWAMKKAGVKWIISVSAVGSLKEELKPGHFVFPDQFVDRTKDISQQTFFGGGIVAHVNFGNPVSQQLQTLLFQSAKAMGATCHWGGTYVNMEGPAFSTRAESEMHRQLGFSIIGMTNMPEARLAREAEISYATMAMVTDYDCWHTTEVTVEEVVATLHANADLAKRTLGHALTQIQSHHTTPSHTVLDSAIITPREHWPEEKTRELAPILARYMDK